MFKHKEIDNYQATTKTNKQTIHTKKTGPDDFTGYYIKPTKIK